MIPLFKVYYSESLRLNFIIQIFLKRLVFGGGTYANIYYV